MRLAFWVALALAVLALLAAGGALVRAAWTADSPRQAGNPPTTVALKMRPSTPKADAAWAPVAVAKQDDDAPAEVRGDKAARPRGLRAARLDRLPARAADPHQPQSAVVANNADNGVTLEPAARALQREWPGLAAVAPAAAGPAAAVPAKKTGFGGHSVAPAQGPAPTSSMPVASPPAASALLPAWPAPIAAPAPPPGSASAGSSVATSPTDQAPAPPPPPAPAKAPLAVPTPVPTPPADPLPGCLATPTAGLVKSVWVSAKDGQGIDIHLPMAARYLVLAKGVFHYSPPGHQDAMRRWYDPPRDIDPTCVNCAFHPLAAKYALQLNGVAHKPVRSCVLEHLHLFSVLAPTAKLHVRIADAKMDGEPYGDNEGGLTIEVWRPAASDAAVWPEWDGAATVQGVATGNWLGELVVGTNWVLSVQLGVVLHEALATMKVPQGEGPLYADLYGTAAWQGSERDWHRQWDHVQGLSGFGPPPVAFNCAKVEEVANSHIHRYLLRLHGCPASLEMTLLPPLGVGQFTAEIYNGL